MNKLLNQIEKSEQNNPQFKAALEEIEKLKNLLEEIKSIAYGQKFSYIEDDGVTVIEIPEEDQGEYKIAIIQSMTLFNYL